MGALARRSRHARAVPEQVRSSALALRTVADRVGGRSPSPGLVGAVAAATGGAGAWWLSCAVPASAAVTSSRATLGS